MSVEEKFDVFLKTIAAINLIMAISAVIAIEAFQYPLTVKSFAIIWFPLYVFGVSLAERYRVLEMNISVKRAALEWIFAISALLLYIIIVSVFG